MPSLQLNNQCTGTNVNVSYSTLLPLFVTSATHCCDHTATCGALQALPLYKCATADTSGDCNIESSLQKVMCCPAAHRLYGWAVGQAGGPSASSLHRLTPPKDGYPHQPIPSRTWMCACRIHVLHDPAAAAPHTTPHMCT